jgi:hypothetical protein
MVWVVSPFSMPDLKYGGTALMSMIIYNGVRYTPDDAQRLGLPTSGAVKGAAPQHAPVVKPQNPAPLSTSTVLTGDRPDWMRYALTQGLDAADVDGLTKAELIELLKES